MGSDTDNVEPSGAVWLDDLCSLWVYDEVGKVGGDDEGGEGCGEGGEGGEGADDEVQKVSGHDESGEGVLGVEPVPLLLILPNCARQEQAGHTAEYQTAPMWFLWQLPHGLLFTNFATKK